MCDSAHFEEGDATDVAFVFSCPGRKEEEAQRPASGGTGVNLCDLLRILVEKHRDTVAKITGLRAFRRGYVRITNAWAGVEYAGKNPEKPNRTEADDDEILDSSNLDRLQRDLSGIEHAIICCGDKASLAVGALRERQEISRTVGVFSIPHLGNRVLNSKYRNDMFPEARNSMERRFSRLGLVAECLSRDIDLWFASEARRQSAVVANSPWEPEDQAFVNAISVWNEE